jgi:hypothetical protein
MATMWAETCRQCSVFLLIFDVLCLTVYSCENNRVMSRDTNNSLTVIIDCQIIIIIIIIIIFSGSAAQRRLWPPRSRGYLITHNDAPQSVGRLWTSNQLVAEHSTWQLAQPTDIQAPGGIRTHDHSKYSHSYSIVSYRYGTSHNNNNNNNNNIMQCIKHLSSYTLIKDNKR